MSTPPYFLFLSLFKHHKLYFGRLLQETELTGKLVEPPRLPLPRPWKLLRIWRRVNWSELVETKCHERFVKHKYSGVFFRWLLRLELLWMALSFKELLDREKPGCLVFWNGSHRYCQLLIGLKPKETGAIFFENGLLPDTTTVDSRGVNFHNSVPREAQFYLDYYREKVPSDGVGTPVLVPRKPRRTDLVPITLPERYVFVPFQDDRDSQIRFFSPWLRNMRDLFAVGEHLAAETGLNVVFKEHPSSRESYPDLHQRTSQRLIFANGNNTQELIESCLFVMTVNSTVGVESLLLGKPVLTLGQAFFNIPGLVAHADSSAEVSKMARQFPEWSLDDRIRRAFLAYMADDYCVRGGWRNADQEQLNRVAERMLRICHEL